MPWQEELRKVINGKKLLILGVGNEMKADDGLGHYVISKIKTENKLFCGEMPENFISKIKENGAEVILIIDAVDFNEKPGEIAFVGVEQLQTMSLSTHSMSFSIMATMLPEKKIYLLGVQPKSLEFGGEMSKEATEGADKIIVVLDTIFN